MSAMVWFPIEPGSNVAREIGSPVPVFIHYSGDNDHDHRCIILAAVFEWDLRILIARLDDARKPWPTKEKILDICKNKMWKFL